MRAKFQRAFKPISTYVDVTVVEPCKAINEFQKSKKKYSVPSATKTRFSMRAHLEKQKEMVSPESAHVINPAFGLRGHYLNALGSPAAWVIH